MQQRRLDIESLKQRCYSINGHPMLVVTEGGFKAIALCSHGIPTIALLGVEMGLTPAKDDPQGKRYLVPELERFARVGFGFILAFDCDAYTKKPVKQALIKLARQLQRFSVPVYNLPKWDEEEGKGVDDFIQNKGIEAFRQELLSQANCFEEWYEKYGEEAFDTVEGKKIPKADLVGKAIAETNEDKWQQFSFWKKNGDLVLYFSREVTLIRNNFGLNHEIIKVSGDKILILHPWLCTT